MMIMMNMNTENWKSMAGMMAEDTGAYELRNPVNSGMRHNGHVFFARLFDRKRK